MTPTKFGDPSPKTVVTTPGVKLVIFKKMDPFDTYVCVSFHSRFDSRSFLHKIDKNNDSNTYFEVRCLCLYLTFWSTRGQGVYEVNEAQTKFQVLDREFKLKSWLVWKCEWVSGVSCFVTPTDLLSTFNLWDLIIIDDDGICRLFF